ncbi:YlcI/YnfO family protein [Paraburkholderia franconis]
MINVLRLVDLSDITRRLNRLSDPVSTAQPQLRYQFFTANDGKMYRKSDTWRSVMKTATIPALRVEPDLRRAAEEVLNENESLSSFMEASLRASIAQRKLQREFIARGLAARNEARETGEYYEAVDVHAELEGMLQTAKRARNKP